MANLIILIALVSNLQLISAQPSVGEFIIGADGYVSSNLGSNDHQILRIVAPDYPMRAQQREIAGWNLASFTVNKDGDVDADTIVVVDSEPPGVFDSASIRAIAQFKFLPTIASGTKLDTKQVQYVIRYVLEGRKSVVSFANPKNRDYLPLNYITPEYPVAAREESVEGHVLVEFTVTKQGIPRGIVILDRSPSDIFNASAVNAAERFRFDPRVMDGEPVEAEGAQYLFNFKP